VNDNNSLSQLKTPCVTLY